MKRILTAALLFNLIGCSDYLGFGGGPPADLLPAKSLAVVQIANPSDLDRKLGEMGAPPVTSMLAFLGVLSSEGLDTERPWYLAWVEDLENTESPALLLPLNDREAFEALLGESQSGFTTAFQDDYVLLVKGDLPELGGNSIFQGFSGDLEIHADLEGLQVAYADEIQAARDSLQENMGAGLEAVPGTPTPGFDPASFGDLMEAQSDLMFGILEQSEALGVSFNLDAGRLDWTARWGLKRGTQWGTLVSDQEPEVPFGLGRVDLDRPMVFWMNHNLGASKELLQPFFEAMSGLMKGIDPEVMFSLAGREIEGVMSMEFTENGMEMEGVYSLPDMEVSEYKELVRDQMGGLELEVPGVTFEYRQHVGEIEGVEVDVLVQDFQVPEDEETPFPLERMEVYYGWGEEEVFTMVASGGEDAGMEALGTLISREPGTLPDGLRDHLDYCPDELLMFGLIDLGRFMEGILAWTPESPETSLSARFPPMVFYGTSEGSEFVYGGSFDVKAVTEAASEMIQSRR